MNGNIQFVDDLLKEFRESEPKPSNPVKVTFNQVDGFDVYNPTAPFEWNGETYMIGRVEKRDSEHSKSIFFVLNEDGSYSPKNGIPEFILQDPYISFIDEFIVFGGTEIFELPEDPSRLGWRAKFYYGTDLTDLKELTVGPEGKKDIRIVKLSDGRIGVFSRPQGEKGGRGKIGFTIVDKLTDVTSSVIDDAPLFEQFDDQEWGGCNEATLLSNGKIGVLGHIAKFSEGDVRHYYPMTFCVDPVTREYSKMKIISERANFLPGPAKRPDLADVLFSAGLVRHGNGKATLYTGVSDVEVQAIEIADPFAEYE